MATYSLLFGHAEWRAGDGPHPEESLRTPPAGRLTLKLPAALRGRIESSAARDGLSPDEWASLVLVRALEGTPTLTAR